MTKQQIVVQLVAAKIANSELVFDDELVRYGKLADKIIEMFPEPDYSITTKGTTYKFDDNTIISLSGGNLA